MRVAKSVNNSISKKVAMLNRSSGAASRYFIPVSFPPPPGDFRACQCWRWTAGGRREGVGKCRRMPRRRFWAGVYGQTDANDDAGRGATSLCPGLQPDRPLHRRQSGSRMGKYLDHKSVPKRAGAQSEWSDVPMRPPVLGTLLATLALFLSCAAASAQTMPRVGERWQLKVEGFGCAKNDDLDRLLRLLHGEDPTEFRTLLLRYRGEGLCRDLPKGLPVVVDRIEPYGMLNDRPCVRQGGDSDCWYTLPAFLQPISNQ